MRYVYNASSKSDFQKFLMCPFIKRPGRVLVSKHALFQNKPFKHLTNLLKPQEKIKIGSRVWKSTGECFCYNMATLSQSATVVNFIHIIHKSHPVCIIEMATQCAMVLTSILLGQRRFNMFLKPCLNCCLHRWLKSNPTTTLFQMNNKFLPNKTLKAWAGLINFDNISRNKLYKVELRMSGSSLFLFINCIRNKGVLEIFKSARNCIKRMNMSMKTSINVGWLTSRKTL